FYASIGTLLLGSIATVADAMVITEKERLDAFVEEVTRSGRGDRIARAMSFADPNREPVAIAYDGDVVRFADGQEVELESALRAALSAFGETDLEAVQEAIELRGEDARVALRVRTGAGLTDAQFELRRHEDRWLLRRVAVR
ncbi:MAG: hypothetical protein H5U40_16925, partial [Polyangiaceae bacterium]|nr:hypothetical protein [Polyangiaceae bacterium]